MTKFLDSFQLISEEKRRKTFKRWKFAAKYPCNADKLAEAGFIFVGSSSKSDAVKCVFCGKELDGWEKNDDPWAEHLSHAPYCKFAQKRKSLKGLTLQEFLEFAELLSEKQLDNEFQSKMDVLNLIEKDCIR